MMFIGAKAQYTSLFKEDVAKYSTGDWIYKSIVEADNNGYVYNATSEQASGITQYALIKYDDDGTEEWAVNYTGSQTTSEIKKMKVHNTNSIYVTGKSGNAVATIKYDANGNATWTQRFQRSGSSIDAPVDMFIDASGNVYVCGSSITGGNCDYFTIKYNSAGTQQWVQYYGGAYTDYATAIAVDPTYGYVYVSGVYYNVGTGLDIVTIAYTSAGVYGGATVYTGNSSYHDYPMEIIIPSSGNIYLTCAMAYQSGVDASSKISTLKYNIYGVIQWVHSYEGSGTGDDVPNSMMVDGSGNVYVNATTTTASNGTDVILLGYSSGGTILENTPIAISSNNEECFGMTIDDDDNVYLVGSTIKDSDKDFFVLRYDGEFNYSIFTDTLDNGNHGHDIGSSVVVDDNGVVFVSGSSQNTSSTFKNAFLKYQNINPENSNNPFDFIGEYNNDILKHIIDNIDDFGSDTNSIIKEASKMINKYCYDNRTDLESKINTAIPYYATHTYQLSDTEKNYYMDIDDLFEDAYVYMNTDLYANINSLITSLKSIENAVANNGSLDSIAKKNLFCTLALTKYSLVFWGKEFQNRKSLWNASPMGSTNMVLSETTGWIMPSNFTFHSSYKQALGFAISGNIKNNRLLKLAPTAMLTSSTLSSINFIRKYIWYIEN
jgi:hypothetical protein